MQFKFEINIKQLIKMSALDQLTKAYPLKTKAEITALGHL